VRRFIARRYGTRGDAGEASPLQLSGGDNSKECVYSCDALEFVGRQVGADQLPKPFIALHALAHGLKPPVRESDTRNRRAIPAPAAVIRLLPRQRRRSVEPVRSVPRASEPRTRRPASRLREELATFWRRTW